VPLAFFALTLGALANQGLTQQARSPEAIAAAVPLDVPEIISGGSWKDGQQRGIYRAVVVLTGSGEADFAANVVVQWIGSKGDGSRLEIVKAVPIADFNQKKMANAFLSLESDVENEVVIAISAYDVKTQKESMFAYKAAKPGVLTPTAPPQQEPGGASAQKK
jgi:hypothetical protein